MPKPWNPHSRPMSLAESEALLKSEAERRQGWEDWKGFGLVVGFFACMIVLVLSYGAIAWGFIGNLALLFR